MNDIFDNDTWNEFVSGYTITDCAIPKKNSFGFLLVEEKTEHDTLPMTRFINMSLDRPINQRFAVHVSTRFKFSSISASMAPPEYVAVDTISQVYSANALKKGMELPIDEILDMNTIDGKIGIITKVARAAGKIYALGDYRRIYRRSGPDTWIELGTEDKGVPLPADVASLPAWVTLHFKDMSAFSEDDMYVVGDRGDIWRFDGRQWHNCPIPTNSDLLTVCCASNGLVYISEKNGSVWAGREDRWERVAEADITPGYHPVDSFWFNDRLYLGGFGGLWTIDEQRKVVIPLGEVEADAPKAPTSGRLDISLDGKFLLTSGPYGACLHDGTGWRQLFSAFDFV
ncbi:hypothetical protein INH39_01905 [Massilia violaceinigra]|uniref:Uncharacterized protein n=1 Tax=Massilia violaceinigra TaxID=2045208 RepID=A0ABY4A6W8_9BURK|nr:hypothetical protein [Massilia violaceinigra]UOD30529.1 hypothetical protein INH39_01905 [Massilia violaceinigra]